MTVHRPYTSDCHVRLGVELVAHTWDAVVLTLLRDGPARRRDMLRDIGGISDKVLHESLRRLCDRGLAERVPDGVGFRLTTTGASLAHGPLLALARWAEENAAELDAV
ncbi:winged helix-turn-helix transcriptional regulator [Pseudonocardia alni]|uniref:winged helix-turn-helix transcriptional regulator n=1 Tax=Pseudonocardia alni TaxID=33907 RepID=UPI00280A7B5A|nr:helix-turn-helix domain-containing protein [Pseudonocardia alni]